MGREIKFRVWDKEYGMMSCVNSYPFSNFRFEEDGKFKALASYDSERMKLMQFTGLKDINGVEIYEGDIVYCVTNDPSGKPEQEAKFVVEFDYGSFLAMTASEEQFVIGNIHQNPELIAS